MHLESPLVRVDQRTRLDLMAKVVQLPETIGTVIAACGHVYARVFMPVAMYSPCLVVHTSALLPCMHPASSLKSHDKVVSTGVVHVIQNLAQVLAQLYTISGQAEIACIIH